MTKAEQRKHFLSLRAKQKDADHASQSRAVSDKLIRLIKKRNAKIVHCFIPMMNEINILPVIEYSLKNNIKIICPKTLAKRKLRHLILENLTQLSVGPFGTLHPSGNNEFQESYDLIIVPALAIDEQGYRLGYGGGYYDAFLKISSAFKVAPVFSFQTTKKLAKELHDERVDLVITI